MTKMEAGKWYSLPELITEDLEEQIKNEPMHRTWGPFAGKSNYLAEVSEREAREAGLHITSEELEKG